MDPERSTSIFEPSESGESLLRVASADGFRIGDEITINPGGAPEEVHRIAGFGSISLEEPLVFRHEPGERIERRTHDLAIRQLKVRKRVTLSDKKPVLAGKVVVKIQNQSPREEVILVYTATFDCANDPLKTKARDPLHDDFEWTASLDDTALDGIEDDDPLDDQYPHTMVPPSRIDPNSDGRLEDKGCGGKQADRTFGGSILIDIVDDRSGG